MHFVFFQTLFNHFILHSNPFSCVCFGKSGCSVEIAQIFSDSIFYSNFHTTALPTIAIKFMILLLNCDVITNSVAKIVHGFIFFVCIKMLLNSFLLYGSVL